MIRRHWFRPASCRFRTTFPAALTVVALAVVGLPGGVAGADNRQPSLARGPERAGSTDLEVRRAEELFARSVESRQVIVKFTDESSPSGQAALRSKYGLTAVRSLRTKGTRVFSVAEGRSAEAAATSLRRERGVAYAEPNQLWMAHRPSRASAIGSRVAATSESPAGTSDPLLGQLWGLDNTGQLIGGVQGTANVDVNAPEAWRVTKGAPGVVVGIIDTGVDIDHPDLAGQIWTNPGEIAGNGIDDDRNGYIDDVHGWDFLNDDNTVFDAPDGDEHGTHVAGTVAADLENGVGIAGVAPGVAILPLKFLGPNGGTTTGAIEAIDYATRMGVRVLNASWGGSGYSTALRDAIARSGAAFVAAAGNAGTNNDLTPAYPSSYDLPNVLSVAAVDNTGRLASFSNYGKTSVDVGAPGVSVLSTVPAPREAAQALQVTSASPSYKAMVWGFGLEDVTGATSRNDALARSLSFLGAAPGAPVLIVDDDGRDSGAGDTASFYATSLTAAGFTSVTTHVVPVGASGPDAAAMQGRTVIWQTGDAESSGAAGPNLTAADQSALTTFLEAGGNLLLAGADALYSIESSALVADRLHAVHLGEGDVRTDVTGVAGSVFAGAAYAVTGADSPGAQPHPYRDILAPRDSAAAPALVLSAGDYANAYESYNGTSMAAPHAAGVAALAATTRPTASGAAIVDVVRTTGSTLPSLADTTATGRLVRADAVVSAAGEFYPLSPARVLDTRYGTGGFGTAIGPGQSIDVQVTGVGGVPTTGVAAVAVNATVTQPTSQGFLTVHPAGTPLPLVSNLNFVPEQTVPNLVVAKVGAGGKLTVYNSSGSTHVVFDVAGWFSDGSAVEAGALYSPLPPARVLDTRYGTGGVLNAIGPGETVDVQVTGVGGVPASGVSAVVLNVTVTQPTAQGFLTVHPAGTPLPLVSNLNFVPELTVPNLVMAKVGAGGKVSVYNSSGLTHVVFDVSGWFSDGSSVGAGERYSPLPPARVLDTRYGTGGISAAVGSGETVDVQVTGVGGVPATGVSAVVLNVTVTQPTTTGFLTIHPAGTPLPIVSNLNFTAGRTVPNLVVAKVGAGGKVSLYNSAGSSHVVFDVAGWYSASS